MIVSLCQVKKKGHFKAWEWRGAFHRLLCCKKKDHYQRHRNCSKGWNHSWHIQGGSPHGQHYLGWGHGEAGSAAAAWPGDDAPHHLQGLQGTSCFLPFIWARRITAEPHRCQWFKQHCKKALGKSACPCGGFSEPKRWHYWGDSPAGTPSLAHALWCPPWWAQLEHTEWAQSLHDISAAHVCINKKIYIQTYIHAHTSPSLSAKQQDPKTSPCKDTWKWSVRPQLSSSSSYPLKV